jgi:hypothetical protein
MTMPLKGCCVSISDEDDNASFANYSLSRLDATPNKVAVPLNLDTISLGNSSSLDNSCSTIISFSSGFDDDGSYFLSTSTLSIFEDDESSSELLENSPSHSCDQSETQAFNLSDPMIKKVRFGDVAVREYALTIGNTTWTEKCPLQLSW